MLSATQKKNGQWEDEMVALETQLNASVRMQIENTRDGIRRLGESQDRLLGGVGSALGEALSLCQASEGLVASYGTVKQVSRTFQNFRLVNAVYEQFRSLNETVERTAALLEADKEAGSSDNLLLVFFHLSRLEAFRAQTLGLMQDGPSTSVYTLRRYFKRLDDLSAEFEAFFWALPPRFFVMALDGEQRVIVRVLKVLSRRGDSAGAETRLFDLLEAQIADKFQVALSVLDGPVFTEIEGALQAIAFWHGDLATIRSAVAPCFPPAMCILNFYAQAYHRQVHAVLTQCLSLPEGRRHEVADILFILRWVKDYGEQMSLDIGFGPEDLDVRLFDERQEARLIAEYVSVSRVKIAEWIGNLYEGVRAAFVERPVEPDVDANNCYLSPAAVDLIQIIKQNIMTTSESSRGKLILEIIAETCKSVADFQKRLGGLLEAEASKHLAPPDKSSPREDGDCWFEAHVLMMGNTGLRWATSLQSEIVESLESLVAAEYLAGATKHLKALGDGFINIAKIASLCLCRLIFAALAPATQQLFAGPAWYGGQPPLLNTVAITLGDFLDDYRVHAEDFLFNKLVADLLETFILTYLRQLRAKSTRLRSADCHDFFGEDLTAATEYFSTLRDPRRVQKAIEPLDKFVDLITASPKVIYLEFFSFWKAYPDLPIGFLEEVLARRDDLDRSAIKEIVETCRKKTLEEKPPTDIQPSIFSKI